MAKIFKMVVLFMCCGSFAIAAERFKYPVDADWTLEELQDRVLDFDENIFQGKAEIKVDKPDALIHSFSDSVGSHRYYQFYGKFLESGPSFVLLYEKKMPGYPTIAIADIVNDLDWVDRIEGEPATIQSISSQFGSVQYMRVVATRDAKRRMCGYWMGMFKDNTEVLQGWYCPPDGQSLSDEFVFKIVQSLVLVK